MQVDLLDGGTGPAELVVASERTAIELSQLVPLLGSLGLWVIDEVHAAEGSGERHRLSVRRTDEGGISAERDGARLSDAVAALWAGRADIDGLNRLVTVAAMPWRDVAILRAYRRYRRQVDQRYSSRYMDDTLVAHPEIAQQLVALFRTRFAPDPLGSGPDLDAAARQAEELTAACDRVARLDHDRILRGLAGTVGATLRTNLAARPDGPLALKLDPSAVPDAPAPVPYREIFVHGPTVEGVHLRAGPVARGGLRFSDRPEDLRTEVLDLMRTQVLKNALIVPTGAKGGFVSRGPLRPGSEAAATGAAYEAFVGALLDVTDDLDGDDPYLVVAADKGTAAFSDVANRIAVDRGYWLGDAFASGGSIGYDHRQLGITARGAWVAVARHFRELAIDVAREPFTVAGIGDMSGDVFGNGMLLSDQICLVAAFDHRDVFLDPDPDPAATIAVRRALHDRPGSSWQDFDRAAISAGGGVFSRSEKRVELSPQAQSALRTSAEVLTPAELVQAVLRAPVDLLYLGGVGTYVRASTEPDATIDDRSNAEVRIAASELRCRVVGEGANLGFTQRARIEYARRGGRINTDAIDNSAGVDTSDHEVNIKILLGLAVDDGLVSPAERPELLRAVTDDVVAAVLADSADQSDGLRRARDASAAGLDAFEAAQAELVRSGVLDPGIERLPDAAEYDARRRAGAGLTRPELAVLLAGAKRRVKAEVLSSDLPDDPAAHDALVGYFPPLLATRFAELLPRHRLCRELIASEVANDLVDHLGPTAVFDLEAESGLGPADVAAAYWVARAVVASPELWDALGAVPAGGGPTVDGAGDDADAGLVLAGLLGRLTRHELIERARRLRGADSHDLERRIAEVRPVFAELQGVLPVLDRPDAARQRRALADRMVAGGSPRPLAEELALAAELAIAPEVAASSRRTNRSVAVVAGAFLELSDALGIDRLLAAVDAVPHTTVASAPEEAWPELARRGLVDDLASLRRHATDRVLAAGSDHPAPLDQRARVDGSPVVGVDLARVWLDQRADAVGRATELVRRVVRSPEPSLEGLSVAVRALRLAVS